jgi:hypothetical protein
MTFEPDTLIAIAFFAPVVSFAVLNVVTFRMHLYTAAVKPVAPEAAADVDSVAANAVAANDDEIREAA